MKREIRRRDKKERKKEGKKERKKERRKKKGEIIFLTKLQHHDLATMKEYELQARWRRSILNVRSGFVSFLFFSLSLFLSFFLSSFFLSFFLSSAATETISGFLSDRQPSIEASQKQVKQTSE